jgi:pSer/pThr/pTyr-binding forkhead associated (FHA) protein
MAMEDATLIKRGHQTFVLRAQSSGEEYLLQGEMLVGREVECAITLNSGHISRYHAKINVSPNGVYIEDLHSTNGTFVNGQKIKGRVRLAVGDEVAFDDFNFRLTSGASGSAADTALSPRRHAPQETQIPPRPQLAPRPVRPSMVPARSDALQDLSRVDDLLKAAAEVADAKARVSAKQSAPVPAPTASAAPEAAEEHTQLLSAKQLDRLVERGRQDLDLQVGSGPRLLVMTAPLRGKLFELEAVPLGTSWQIGRDTHAEIYLNDKTISNDHARLAKNAEGYLLTATHAKNGILVNGVAKGRAYLNHNDRIQIGRTELVFKTDDSTQRKVGIPTNDIMADGSRMSRNSVIMALVALVVLVSALFATAR